MNLQIRREVLDAEIAWLASHRGAMYKTGGITLSQAHCPIDLATGRRVYRSGSFVGVIAGAAGIARGLWTQYRRGAASYDQLATDAAVPGAGLIWTARTPGVSGVTIRKADPGAPDRALGVVVVGQAITVNLATSPAAGGAAITTTAQDIIDAIRANAAANALVHVELERGHDGTGLVTADVAPVPLAGGVAAAGAQAVLNTGVVGNNNAITWTAREVGAAGNNIQVALIDPNAASQPLSVVMAGSGTVADPYIITVNLATTAVPALDSTALEVMHAVRAHALANALVDVASTGASTGAGVVAAEAAAPLAGGTDHNVSLAAGQFGILVQDVDVTDGNSLGAILTGGKVLDGRLPAPSDAFVRAALPLVQFTVENAP